MRAAFICNALGDEQLSDCGGDVGTGYTHWRRFRGVHVDLHGIRDPALAAEGIEQHGSFVRRGRTLVRWRGRQHGEAARTKTLQRIPQGLGTLQRAEVVSGIPKSRNILRIEGSAKCDHEKVQ